MDHGSSYKLTSVFNLPHILRKKHIEDELSKLARKEFKSVCDVGCSYGHHTELIARKFPTARVCGCDYNSHGVAAATERYPNLSFFVHNLLVYPSSDQLKFELVFCSETLEHCGDLHVAVYNLSYLVEDDGELFVTVPDETGVVGIIKFLAKILLRGDALTELYGHPSRFRYFGALLTGKISRFRDSRTHWSTHFGFDYRLVVEDLKGLFQDVQVTKRGTTVFIRCRNRLT